MHCDDFLVALLADDDTCITPGEVVLFPKGVDGEDEAVDGVGEDIYYHPSYVLPLAFKNEDDGLKTVDGGYHDDGDEREGTCAAGDHVDEVAEVDTGSWQDECSEEIQEYDETHREAAEAAQVIDPNQFGQIVDSRIDPSSSLREQD